MSFQSLLRNMLYCAIALCTGLAFANPVRSYVYDFYPLADADNLDGPYPGFFYEISLAILESSGLDYQISVEPIARTLQSIKQGQADMVVGLPIPDSDLTVPIHCNQIVVVTNSDVIKSIKDLEGRRLGFVSNGLFERLYSEKFGTINESSSSNYGLISMLHYNRIDGFMMTKSVINAYKIKAPFGTPLPERWSENLRYAVTIQESQVYLQLPKNNNLTDVQRQRLISSAYDLNEKGVFREILSKYGTDQIQKCSN